MPQAVNILLVDDEPRNLDVLEAVLEDPGYRLLRASDADTALRLLLENDVAAIVLDIKMPGVSGFELAQLIKRTKKFRQIPIVFMTAYMVDDRDVVAGYGAGAVDYLTKPVNPQILRQKVSVFAELFRKTRALAELNDHLEVRVRDRTAELEKSDAALRAANLQKDRFLATLAHELRNPLAPLRTGLDLLLRHPDPAEADRVLGAMNRQLDHVVRLVDDLLDVSRISRGTLELRKERIELSAVLDRAVEMANAWFERRKQVITVDAEEAIGAFADPTRIAQIITNLLHNASKHSAVGASVRIELRRRGGNATIRVVDEGAGIPSDQLGRVFEMFTHIERSEHATDGGGLGIGLALSRQLAQLHGGTLTAESAGERKGSAFTVTLPALPAGAKEAAEPPPVKPRPASGQKASLNIVVVEDNEDVAEVTSSWLQHFGYSVSVAGNGSEGVSLVHETRPDVVFCDLGLPDIDGVEVCRRIVGALDPPPVMIAMTGRGMDADRKRALAAGFRHHLLKPVHPETLRATLDAVMHVDRAGNNSRIGRHGESTRQSSRVMAKVAARVEETKRRPRRK
jgi:CheY-like chemotaxis protein/nitrogen-specific signal transduction histidine kinase